MKDNLPKRLYYYPGCSLVTSAKECHVSVVNVCRWAGIELIELEDWNCCGASSAHSINSRLAYRLAWRVLSLVPEGYPLLVVCPSCLLRLRLAQHQLLTKEEAQREYRRFFGRPPVKVEIMPFLELLTRIDWRALKDELPKPLQGLRFASYYGCMLCLPPNLNHLKNYYDVMESIGKALGGEPISWGYTTQCCGTYLSVVRPDIVTGLVNRIISEAKDFGAECLVTPCSMCQLNLEIRCDLDHPLPVLHFSELVALALGVVEKNWFKYHLIDPRPTLHRYKLV